MRKSRGETAAYGFLHRDFEEPLCEVHVAPSVLLIATKKPTENKQTNNNPKTEADTSSKESARVGA